MNYSLESFIDYCDEMLITNEGYADIKSKEKLIKTKIDLLKIKIHKNDGNYAEQEKAINDIIKELENLKRIVESLDITGGDKVRSKIRSIFGITKIIVGVLIAIPTLGLGTILCVNSALDDFNDDPKFYKKYTLRYIEYGIKGYNKLKVYLKKYGSVNNIAEEGFIQRYKDRKEMKRLIKDAGYKNKNDRAFYHDIHKADSYINKYESIGSADNYAKENKEKYSTMLKMANEIKANINKANQKNKWHCNKVSLYREGKKIEILITNDDWNTEYYDEEYPSVYKAYDKILSDVKKKYLDKIKKYNIHFDENPDEILALSIKG